MIKIKYGSTFTGIGGFELAIKSVFKDSRCVYYSEYDKFANQTYLKNYPWHSDLNIGDIERAVFDLQGTKLVVNEYRVKKLFPKVDLLTGGPPCQDLTIANRQKGKGLAGEKSKLFFAFLAVLKITKPKHFLMENVFSMTNENRDKISEFLGVQPVAICVDRFTPQKRWRYYWFDWDLDLSLLPVKGDRWDDLIAWSSSNDYKYIEDNDGNVIKIHSGKRQRETRDGRANTLTAGKGCGSYSSKNYREIDGVKRILSPIECEILQGLPQGWTHGVSYNQQYKQIGNAVNPDTVREILKQCPLNSQLDLL